MEWSGSGQGLGEKLLARQEGLYSMESVISMFHLHQLGEYKQICE